MNPADLLIPILSLVLGAGGAPLVKLLKVGPERGGLIVQNAASVVVLQGEFIEEQKEQLLAKRTEITDLTARVSRMEEQLLELRGQLLATTVQRDAFKEENTRLTTRVEALEVESAGLKVENAGLKSRVEELERREGRLETEVGRITPPDGTPAT